MHPSQVPNINLHTIIDLFLRNRIPPEWVDHGYTFGLNFINHQYSTSQLVIFYDELDNERLERLRVYGVPLAIPAWDGWRCPTDEDMHHIHQLVAYRAVQEAPDYDHRTERGWSRLGDDRIYQYLTDRTESSALSYRNLHHVSLPSFPLPPSTGSTSGADTHMSAPNPVGPTTSTEAHAPMEVEATVNAEAPLSSGAVQDSLLMGTGSGAGNA